MPICGFSSSSHPRRELVFQGHLTMRCFSQFSLLIGQLGQFDPHRSIRCTLLRAITQSPRPSQCHLSTSYCSG
ncbi:hypothetical protein M405DRAFT_821957, partial [Rhizopogon salebrosus TDB-379]